MTSNRVTMVTVSSHGKNVFTTGKCLFIDLLHARCNTLTLDVKLHLSTLFTSLLWVVHLKKKKRKHVFHFDLVVVLSCMYEQ